MTNKIDSFYLPLEKLLLAQRWREADMETRRIMLAIAGAHTRDNLLLTQQDMEEFPCSHFIAIDRHWQKYSNGKFGFSIQKRIYQQVGNSINQLALKIK